MEGKIVLSVFVLLFFFRGEAQQIPVPRINQYLDLAGVIGSSEGTISFSYVHNWRLGKEKRIEAGLGLRSTTYWGNGKEFYTAPARLSRSTTIPFIIVFAGHEYQNVDTLTVHNSLVSSLNMTINLGYDFSRKWYAGFNIDLIGFTVGRSSEATLLSNGKTISDPAAKPCSFNLLLTGDNDLGSLNSEFFAGYHLSSTWSIRAVYQFYFAEYQTQHIEQIAPDGTPVTQFRNKANLFGLGLSYHL